MALPSLVTLVQGFAAPPSEVALTLLSESHLAKCMDGSPAGYYFAKNASSSSWIVELQGGGECATKTGCEWKQHSPLSSSRYFKPSVKLGFLLQDGADINPLMSTWNRVFIPYCSQDLWTGQRQAASAETFGFYFAGKHILDAVLTALDPHGLATASNIVLTGESAGGIGVWPNLDALAERYPRARVVGAPIAGFYAYAYPYTGPGHTSSNLADFRESAWPSHVKLWNSTVDKSCAAVLPPYHCMLSNYSYDFISTPVFITEALTDMIQLTAHDWVPGDKSSRRDSAPVKDYVSRWSANMTAGLARAMDAASPNGVFAAACWIHTTFTPTSPMLSGQSYIDAFTRWFKGDTVKLQDDCGVLCNPSCPH